MLYVQQCKENVMDGSIEKNKRRKEKHRKSSQVNIKRKGGAFLPVLRQKGFGLFGGFQLSYSVIN